MGLSSYQSTARVHPVHVINAEMAPVAADLWTKSIDLSPNVACRLSEFFLRYEQKFGGMFLTRYVNILTT